MTLELNENAARGFIKECRARGFNAFQTAYLLERSIESSDALVKQAAPPATQQSPAGGGFFDMFSGLGNNQNLMMWMLLSQLMGGGGGGMNNMLGLYMMSQMFPNMFNGQQGGAATGAPTGAPTTPKPGAPTITPKPGAPTTPPTAPGSPQVRQFANPTKASPATPVNRNGPLPTTPPVITPNKQGVQVNTTASKPGAPTTPVTPAPAAAPGETAPKPPTPAGGAPGAAPQPISTANNTGTRGAGGKPNAQAPEPPPAQPGGGPQNGTPGAGQRGGFRTDVPATRKRILNTNSGKMYVVTQNGVDYQVNPAAYHMVPLAEQ